MRMDVEESGQKSKSVGLDDFITGHRTNLRANGGKPAVFDAHTDDADITPRSYDMCANYGSIVHKICHYRRPVAKAARFRLSRP